MPGDGRKLTAVGYDTVNIRAEDGRFISHVDLRPFLRTLPFGYSTSNFSTHDASGSTSQAANIIEALELGATCLLLDEDTCATNLMIRDLRMQVGLSYVIFWLLNIFINYFWFYFCVIGVGRF